MGMIYSNSQKFWLVVFRIIIGWHFLYEGIVKLFDPNWTSAIYLVDSAGLFKEMFVNMASNPGMLAVMDFIIVWGLIAIGLSLISGTLARWSALAGIVMLCFFYLSHPPFIGLKYSIPMEGNSLFVNKILIEMVSLVILFLFPTSKDIGIDRFIFKRKK